MILHVLLLTSMLASSKAALQPRPLLRRPGACRSASVILAEGKGGLPPGIADRLSFQTGGYKTANQEEEMVILWNLFKECYPTEEAAEAAVNKNSLVLNPSVRST